MAEVQYMNPSTLYCALSINTVHECLFCIMIPEEFMFLENICVLACHNDLNVNIAKMHFSNATNA